MTQGSNPAEGPVDPGALSFGQVVRQYPVGKLLLVVGTVFGAGFGAGYWIRDKFFAEELQHCRAETRTLEKLAGTLQQAINSGQCVKSEFLAQQDEVRKFLGRIEVVSRAIANVRQRWLEGNSNPIFLQHDYWTSIDLGRFLEDPKVADLVNELTSITIRLNEMLSAHWRLPSELDRLKEVNRAQVPKGQPAQNTSDMEAMLVPIRGQFEQLQAALVRTGEYLKSKYLMQ